MTPVELPVTAEIQIGEALVRQSSGRHRPQAALGVSVAVPVAGRWGVAVEAMGTVGVERSDEIALDQYLVRPAALATITFARPTTSVPRRRPGPDGATERPSAWLGFDVGLGPAVHVTLARWESPDLGTLSTFEPGVRARSALTLGLGPDARLRLQGGLAWRPTGVDHDFTAGLAWAF
ncbi:MAG: hypothetical protein ACK4YP_04880 [Myxococcota bacterium]